MIGYTVEISYEDAIGMKDWEICAENHLGPVQGMPPPPPRKKSSIMVVFDPQICKIDPADDVKMIEEATRLALCRIIGKDFDPAKWAPTVEGVRRVAGQIFVARSKEGENA